MFDPISDLARRHPERLVEDSAAIETQFDAVREWRPVASILIVLRDSALDALAALATVDPEDTKSIRVLQARVHLFSEYVSTVKAIYDRGIEEGRNLDAESVEEARELAGIGDEDTIEEDQTYVDD